jgi:hypothetical protein
VTGFSNARQAFVQTRAALAAEFTASVDDRRALHQGAVGASKQGMRDGDPRPLALLAIGDSWFDYPVTDLQIPFFIDNSIIGSAHLAALGAMPPHVLSLAEHGQAMTQILGLAKLRAMLAELEHAENWFSGKPDALLISGGGDDIAGDQFALFLDPAAKRLDVAAYDGVLAYIATNYQKLFRFRDSHAPGVPIFGHCYDYSQADGRGIPLAFEGPWLRPSFDQFGFSEAERIATMREATDRLHDRLAGLAAEPDNLFTLIDTRGTLQPNNQPPLGYANELHPYAAGFAALARKFADALGI